MTRLIQLQYPEQHLFLNMWRFSSTRWLILSGGSDRTMENIMTPKVFSADPEESSDD